MEFEDPRTPSRRSKRPGTRAAAILLSSFAAAFAVWFAAGRPDPRPCDSLTAADSAPAPDGAAGTRSEPPPNPNAVRTGVVRRGDTASSLLKDLLSGQEIHDLVAASRAVFPLSKLSAGRSYEIRTTQNAFESFRYEIDAEEELVVGREDGRFGAVRQPIAYEVRTELVRGTIRSSLFEAVTDIGERPELALALADIFAWDVDFLLDIRTGDTFQALVERRYRDGKPAGNGRLLAAQFVNQGEAYHAVWFQDGDRPAGYYDLGGNSLRKAFLRAPLAFSRISSGYSQRRFHPIAKTWRAHPAIDYAAPAGTPIKTVGDGVVAARGYTPGNGNFVRIRHNGTYETLYLHMSRFAKGLQPGRPVAQGDVIGYVGSTGLATGPHLCFRMYRNGTPVNPYGIKEIAADPVSPQRMAEFEGIAALRTTQFGAEPSDQASIAEPGAPPLTR